ncbi:MAG: SPASM domain-containing protein, partial [Candidatus Omnitrophota bacterium]
SISVILRESAGSIIDDKIFIDSAVKPSASPRGEPQNDKFEVFCNRLNIKKLPQIANFCRQRTKDYFRFDPFLHLRFDADKKRNSEIESERLSPEQIVALEQQDSERKQALEKNCNKLINPEFTHSGCDHLFRCGTGNGSFTISYDGFFRLCSSLWHPDCVFDLKKGSLAQAWNSFVPLVEVAHARKKMLNKP